MRQKGQICRIRSNRKIKCNIRNSLKEKTPSLLRRYRELRKVQIEFILLRVIVLCM